MSTHLNKAGHLLLLAQRLLPEVTALLGPK
jgi:hypothetical protein